MYKNRRQAVLIIKACVPGNTNREKVHSIKIIQNLLVCYKIQPILERKKTAGKNSHAVHFLRTGDGAWGTLANSIMTHSGPESVIFKVLTKQVSHRFLIFLAKSGC